MLLHIYGIIYTILYVALCKMFIETFAKKRYINNKYCSLLLIGAAIVEYGHCVLSEMCIRDSCLPPLEIP